MAVDIGIPICGILQIQGSSQIPPNFVPLNGQTLNEPRSQLNGVTLPNWNRSEEVIPYQISPYDGNVVIKSPNYSYKIVENNLPEVEMVSKRTFYLQAGNTVTTASGGGTKYLDNESVFTTSVITSDVTMSVDVGAPQDGSARRHVSINDSASVFTPNIDHFHYYNIQHGNSSTYGSSNHTIVENLTLGYGYMVSPTSSSPTLKTNGSTSPTSITFNLERETIKSKWYMRVY